MRVAYHLAPVTQTWRERLLIGAPFIAAAVLMAVVPSDDGPTFCPFALCTGTACPGCGMTRAIAHLIRGDIGTAYAYHPLVFLVSIQALGGWVWFLLRRTGMVAPMRQTTLNIILFGSAVALVAVWALRLVSGTLPAV